MDWLKLATFNCELYFILGLDLLSFLWALLCFFVGFGQTDLWVLVLLRVWFVGHFCYAFLRLLVFSGLDSLEFLWDLLGFGILWALIYWPFMCAVSFGVLRFHCFDVFGFVTLLFGLAYPKRWGSGDDAVIQSHLLNGQQMGTSLTFVLFWMPELICNFSCAIYFSIFLLYYCILHKLDGQMFSAFLGIVRFEGVENFFPKITWQA